MAVIWLHGLGDTAIGWSSFVTALQDKGGVFDHFKFVLPTANERPITINMGMVMPAWADVKGLDPEAQEDVRGWRDSSARLDRLIDREEAVISARKIFVGGFSQGAALAYSEGLRGRRPLGGLVCFSGWVPMRSSYQPEELSHKFQNPLDKIDILHCHGTADELVAVRWGRTSADFVRSLGLSVQFVEYAGMGHSACPEEIEKAAEFLQKKTEIASSTTS